MEANALTERRHPRRRLLGHRPGSAGRTAWSCDRAVGPRRRWHRGHRPAPREPALPARHRIAGVAARHHRPGASPRRRRPGAGGRALACLRRNPAQARPAPPGARRRGLGDQGFRTGQRAVPARGGRGRPRSRRAAGGGDRPVLRQGSRAGPADRTDRARQRRRLRPVGRRRVARSGVPRLHRQRHARRRTRRRDEERAGGRHRRRRRHAAGPQRAGRPDHARPQRDAAPQPRHRRQGRDADGPGGPGRPGAHLHRRSLAQPPPRPRAGSRPVHRTTRCARSARWSSRCRPPTKSCARRSATASNCRSPARCRPCCTARSPRPKACSLLLAREQKPEYPRNLFS